MSAIWRADQQHKFRLWVLAAAPLLTAIHPIPSMAILILGLAIFYAFKNWSSTMQVQDRYLDAFNTILDWDIPEDAYHEAMNAQACHLAGSEAEVDVWRYDISRSVH